MEAVAGLREQVELLAGQLTTMAETVSTTATETELRALRVDADKAVRELQAKVAALEMGRQIGAGDGGGQLYLIDTRSMTPPTYTASRSCIKFKECARKVKKLPECKTGGSESP